MQVGVTAPSPPSLSGERTSHRHERVAQPPFDLQECLARAARGDQQAARELVGRTHAMVSKLVRAYRSRQTSEEDLVQEVYMTMFSKLDRYSVRDGIPFEHWTRD